MTNTFGELFRITTFGESHGGGVGLIIDGCPPDVAIDLERVQHALDRRKPGQSDLTTPRSETDTVTVYSGLMEGRSLGTPIGMMVPNKDAKPEAYEHLKNVYRPSHADYTYQSKYGIRQWQGGGRSSARETISRVAGGAVAAQVLESLGPVEIVAGVVQVHTVFSESLPDDVTQSQIDKTLVRCHDLEVAPLMESRIRELKEQGDSCGGVIEVIARGVPVGLGSPVFGKLEAALAYGLMSIPAVKGVEVGLGFQATTMTGSQHNDAFRQQEGRVGTVTNHSGGIQGGISNGEVIRLRVAFKPTSTIFKTQETVTQDGRNTQLTASGRHDPCVLPRAVPIVESMVALVLLDQWLLHRGQVGLADK